MDNERNALKAGLFIVISIAAAFFIVVNLKGAMRVADPNEDRQVTFKLTDNLSGLGKGDDLRLGGYKVGIVKNIQVVTDKTPDGEPRIVVTFSMPARYKLHPDAQLVVDSSLTGVPYLNIQHLGTGAEATNVDGEPSTLTSVFDVVRGAAPELAGLIRTAKTVTIPKIDDAADHAGEASVQIRDVLGDTKSDIRGTLADLHTSLNSVRDKLPALLDELQFDLRDIGATVDHAQLALADLSVSLANAKDVTSAARSLLITNRGRIDSIVTSLKATGDNLKGASMEIRQSPWRLLYKPGPDEMANLNLFDATREFADGASSLDDAAMALRDSLQDKNADPATVQKLMKRLDACFANFKLVEDKLWGDVK
jgi:ABC-type transporter Mla subunit MlaD